MKKWDEIEKFKNYSLHKFLEKTWTSVMWSQWNLTVNLVYFKDCWEVRWIKSHFLNWTVFTGTFRLYPWVCCDEICAEIKQSQFLSVMADDIPDIFRTYAANYCLLLWPKQNCICKFLETFFKPENLKSWTIHRMHSRTGKYNPERRQWHSYCPSLQWKTIFNGRREVCIQLFNNHIYHSIYTFCALLCTCLLYTSRCV